jgi:hypothetical protein
MPPTQAPLGKGKGRERKRENETQTERKKEGRKRNERGKEKRRKTEESKQENTNTIPPLLPHNDEKFSFLFVFIHLFSKPLLAKVKPIKCEKRNFFPLIA